MTTLSESNASIPARIDSISNYLILISLNIHEELNNGRFSLTRSNEIRKYSNLSLITSSFSNTLIDELLTCIEFYLREVNVLADILCSTVNSLLVNNNTGPVIDDLSKDSQSYLNVLKQYHDDRILAVRSLLSNPFREDGWYLVHEIDLNIFSKCQEILIRLRMYALLMHEMLTNDINIQIKLRSHSPSLHSVINNNKKKTKKRIYQYQII